MARWMRDGTARRGAIALGTAITLALLACAGGSTPSAECDQTVSCPAGQICVIGGHCETHCTPDAGTPCPAGSSCQSTSVYCQGTACSAIQTTVCLPTDGGT